MAKKQLNPILTALLLIILSSCNRIKHLYVQYSEAKLHFEQSVDDSVIRIFFDRNGFIYPDHQIPDKTIKDNFSLLKEVYERDLKMYQTICAKEDTIPNSDVPNLTAMNDKLQAKLVQKYYKRINSDASRKEVVFIIHGFNEHPTLATNDNAFLENKATRESIIKRFPKRSFLFVEIYWDGLSRENGSKNTISQGLNSFKIWNNAQVSATYAGIELRRILSKVNNNKLYILTHSHGAAVATNALFNVIKFPAQYYSDRSVNGGAFILERYRSAMYDCPTQDIHIGMLTPAIPGQNVFDEFYFRTELGTNSEDKSKKNYHFTIGFNRFDRVTRKFYTNSSWFGSSTLASRRSELKATINTINDTSLLDSEDFSYFSNKKKQRLHSWLVYLSNEPAISKFLDKVFL